MFKIGVIGLGHRLSGVIPTLVDYDERFCVTAIADPAFDKVREKIAENPECYAKDVRFYADADEMLEKEELDSVMIGTRCSLHTELAIRVMKKGIPFYLEKPVCTNWEDFNRLREAYKKYDPQVIVSFPLRFSGISAFVKELLDSGKIGEVLQVEAFNDPAYGRVYYHDWYRDENETGGLWLQKATHDFDCLNYFLDDPVEEIFARDVRKLFKGDMPAGLKCEECEKYRTCPESPLLIRHVYQDVPYGTGCCFAKDTGNEDCGSAVLRCRSGAIVTYTQNFFARHKAERRGARFHGYKGTLEFDWPKREVKVFMHDSTRVETYNFEPSGSHHGGDAVQAQLYSDILEGKNKASLMKEGLKSAQICLAAKQSCATGLNVHIEEL